MWFRGIEKWCYCNINFENFFYKGWWWVWKVIYYGFWFWCVVVGWWRWLWVFIFKSVEDFWKWGRKCFGKGWLFGYWYGDIFILMWWYKLCF